jgi:membrane protein involved in colicin uptake
MRAEMRLLEEKAAAEERAAAQEKAAAEHRRAQAVAAAEERRAQAEAAEQATRRALFNDEVSKIAGQFTTRTSVGLSMALCNYILC